MTRQLLATLGLLARLGLGAVLLVAGALKIGDLTGSVQSVVAYQLFPYQVSELIWTVLPVLEIAVGMLLVVGLLTRPAALVGGLLMLTLIAGILSAWARGLSIDCGCFGDGGPVPPGQSNYLGPLLRDGLLAGAAGWLVGMPRTPVSVDALLPTRGTAR